MSKYSVLYIPGISLCAFISVVGLATTKNISTDPEFGCENQRLEFISKNRPSVIYSAGNDTPDLLKNVILNNWLSPASKNKTLEYLTDKISHTCVSTGYGLHGTIGIILKKPIPINSVQLSFDLETFSEETYPNVQIGNDSSRAQCDCKLKLGPSWLRFFCENGTIGEVIVLRDIRKERNFFSLCEIRIIEHVESDKTSEHSEEEYEVDSYEDIIDNEEELPMPHVPCDPSQLNAKKVIISLGAGCALGLFITAMLIGYVIYLKCFTKQSSNQLVENNAMKVVNTSNKHRQLTFTKNQPRQHQQKPVRCARFTNRLPAPGPSFKTRQNVPNHCKTSFEKDAVESGCCAFSRRLESVPEVEPDYLLMVEDDNLYVDASSIPY